MSPRAFAAARIVCALSCSPCAALAAQMLDLAQYAHTAWRVQDGAPGGIRDLAQGADGVLWIASERGLFQFDGVRFEPFEPPPGQTLSPYPPLLLLALPDTSLWIGHFTAGVSMIHGDSVVTYGTDDGLPGGAVISMARDSAGTMWAATSRGLARLVGRRWQEMDSTTGYPGGYTEPVFVDGSGAVWAAAGPDIYVLPKGAVRFEKRGFSGQGLPAADVDVLTPAPDGSVWAIYRSHGIFPLADGRGGARPPSTLAYADTGIYALTWPRGHPAVAVGTSGRLVRIWLPSLGDRQPAREEAAPPKALTIPFSRSAGMSGNLVVAALYDREGSLWVATPTGLDRFRETKLTPVEPLGDLEAAAVAPDTNGAVWIAARRGTPAALLAVGNRIVPRPDAPSMLTCIYRDLRGQLWIGGRALWERKGARFVPVPLPVPPGTPADGREIQAVARERDGGLWVAITFNVGVFRRRPGRGWERFAPRQDPSLTIPNVITTDSSGRSWLGYQKGQLVLVVGDSVRVFAPDQGPQVGRVLAISVYGDRVWIGGQFGIAAFDARQAGAGSPIFVRVHTAGEPLRGISGVVETAEGELWLNGVDGVTRIPAAEVSRALADSGYQVRYERFDYHDGIEPPAQQSRPLPSAVAGTDGRIWFSSAGGVAWIDPKRVNRNPVPPPVQLRALSAGGRRYSSGQEGVDPLRLPPHTSALSIGYTAYSLAVPDRVRFRYRLEGLEPTWRDVGGRREVFFTNLRPGRYRFRVIASNDDGVWNTTGASLAFTIPPAWNQTGWFYGLLALTLLSLPAIAAVEWQRRRSRLAAERAQARFDAMLAERTRVARELHDRLLGGLAGVALQLDASARRLAAGESRETIADLLSTLSSQARNALTETRKSVGAMRTPVQAQPLHEELGRAAERTFSGTETAVHLTQTGTERPYPAPLEAEIVSIASEALANARNHSGCRTVWVICDYGPRELRVGVRDDGRGFDPTQASPAGHWGLVGMRERASAIGARLTITSAPGAGSEVVVVLPDQHGWSGLWARLLRKGDRDGPGTP